MLHTHTRKGKGVSKGGIRPTEAEALQIKNTYLL